MCTLVAFGGDPVKGDLFDEDGNGLEPPAVDEPAEGMLNTVEGVFACESLEVGGCDEDIVLGPEPGVEGGVVEIVHLAHIGLDVSP